MKSTFDWEAARAARKKAYKQVVEWDEYGQAYDKDANLIICICGLAFPGDNHYCPYDEPENFDPNEGMFYKP